jgi:hypothetical protein
VYFRCHRAPPQSPPTPRLGRNAFPIPPGKRTSTEGRCELTPNCQPSVQAAVLSLAAGPTVRTTNAQPAATDHARLRRVKTDHVWQMGRLTSAVNELSYSMDNSWRLTRFTPPRSVLTRTAARLSAVRNCLVCGASSFPEYTQEQHLSCQMRGKVRKF